MKQEDEDLLLTDLCGRLPYKVRCKVDKIKFEGELREIELSYNMARLYNVEDDESENVYVYDCKPYLFPLSSMTKEQYEKWCDLEAEPLDEILTRNANCEKMSTLEHHLLIAKSLTDSINYCYENHFDVYGLIPMGLANDATGLNIY